MSMYLDFHTYVIYCKGLYNKHPYFETSQLSLTSVVLYYAG